MSCFLVFFYVGGCLALVRLFAFFLLIKYVPRHILKKVDYKQNHLT
jgi:hypothetical protein